MKITVEAGYCVRLTGRGAGSLWTTTQGGTYDLDALAVPVEDQDRLARAAGVTDVTPPAKPPKTPKTKES